MNPDGTFTFAPAANINGVVNVSYKTCDPTGACDTATLAITIIAVNDAPVATNIAVTTMEDTPVTGTLGSSVVRY